MLFEFFYQSYNNGILPPPPPGKKKKKKKMKTLDSCIDQRDITKYCFKRRQLVLAVFFFFYN